MSGVMSTKSWASMISIVISFFGTYCFYSFLKSKKEQDEVDEYYTQFKAYKTLEYELNESGSQDSKLNVDQDRQLIAHHYNKSEKLKGSISLNRVLLNKNNRQEDLNALLHFLKKKLEAYPPLLSRELHLINNGYSDSMIWRRHFRVMQWNGLANASCCQSRFGHQLPKELYDWDGFRKWRLLEEIATQDPDIISFQEADFYDDINSHLSLLGYSSVFCPKYTPNSVNLNRDPDGCAVFYRNQVFQQTQLCCDSIRIRGGNQSQVYIITQLKHKATGKRVNIMCVHLKAFIEYADRRIEQTDAILKKLQQVWSTTEERRNPIIICGDFNGQSNEPFYDLMVKQNQFQDAYKHHQASHNQKSERKLIDYIFYTSNIKQMSYLGLKAHNRMFKYLPNIQYPSDHLSLVCDFQF